MEIIIKTWIIYSLLFDSSQKRPQGSSKEFLEMIIIMEVVKLISFFNINYI